ncbi:sugar ABC transporter substrate-binding protein [Mesorhizobium sp. YM1C-6-2]|jgi:ABC-type sugar transport system substrate-binding protein|nr:sugar ABC transporter substrate-binding protein [Mesorhizobium sp. YM1C-6-2]
MGVEKMRQLIKPVIAAGVIGTFLTCGSMAQELDLTKKETYDQIMGWANEPLDTSAFKKDGDLRIGVAAGYLSNAWINFTAQSIKYEASLHPEIKEIKVTDAAFNPSKQAADIDDLLTSGVDAILFWPVDEKAILPVLKKAHDQGVATINIGYNFMRDPSVTSNAYVNQWSYTEQVVDEFIKSLDGKGKVFAMLPIAGSSAAVVQLAVLQDALKSHPDIELISTEYGDWDRAKAKQLTENLLQRFPQIDGAFSPAGQMSMGIYEAFDESGRLEELTLSPGDDYNGWTKLVAKEGKWGSVTSGLEVGREAVKQAVKILTGQPTTTAVVVPTRYLDPAEAAKLNEADRPDDWFKTDLPAEFLPQ